jgi:hypothetical protein
LKRRKSEGRNPTRCDGATARREEARSPKFETTDLPGGGFQIRDSDFGFLSGFGLRVSDFTRKDLQQCLERQRFEDE